MSASLCPFLPSFPFPFPPGLVPILSLTPTTVTSSGCPQPYLTTSNLVTSIFLLLSNTHSMGETEGNSTNGAAHANATSDSSTVASSSSGQDDQPPIAEPPDLFIEKPALPHTLSPQRVAQDLNTDIHDGLSNDEAAARFVRDGPNSIKGAKGVSLWEIFLQQVANALTVVLIAVTALSFAIQDYIEGGVVAAVIVLNIVVGYVLLLRPLTHPRRVACALDDATLASIYPTAFAFAFAFALHCSALTTSCYTFCISLPLPR